MRELEDVGLWWNGLHVGDGASLGVGHALDDDGDAPAAELFGDVLEGVSAGGVEDVHAVTADDDDVDIFDIKDLVGKKLVADFDPVDGFLSMGNF